MSRGDGKALQAGAEVLSERAIAKGPYPGWLSDTTRAIIDSYHDALLSELPAEIEWNVMDGFDEDSPVIVQRESWQRIMDFLLLSLRSSSRGGRTDED